MKYVAHYAKRIIDKLVTRVFILFDALGVIFYLITRNIPQIPGYATVIVFSFIFIYSCYLVWKDERLENEKLKNEIAEIRDSTPKYDLPYFHVSKFTVSKLIEKIRQEVEKLESQVSGTNNDDKIVQNSFTVFNRAVEQASKAMSLAAQLSGAESSEERLARMKDHLENLIAFEKKLKNIYKVELVIESSRSDANIELLLKSEDHALFITDDDLISTYQPRNRKPQSHLTSHLYAQLNDRHLPLDMLPDISQPNQEIELWNTDSIGTHIKWINADHKESVFDEDLFVQFAGNKLKLKVEINSEKLQKTQHLQVNMPLDDITPVQLEER